MNLYLISSNTKTRFLDIPVHISHKSKLLGGLNPSEKYARQLGKCHSQYMESQKIMFQTTNQ